MNQQNTRFDLPAVNEYGFYRIPWGLRKREVSRVLLSGGVNEPCTLQMIRRLAGQGDVISGGAFIGDFLPPIGEALAEDAILHSFEPNPEAFAAAQSVIALNKLSKVRLHPVAVGARQDVLPLQISRPGGARLGGMSRIVDRPIEGTTLDVPVKRLDDLVPADRAVSVLQLDIEGYEWPAILGAQRIIHDSAPVIIVETLKTSEVQVSDELLADTFPDLGYTLMGEMERNTFFAPRADI